MGATFPSDPLCVTAVLARLPVLLEDLNFEGSLVFVTFYFNISQKFVQCIKL